MAEEVIEGAVALASTLVAAVTPYLLSSSLGAVGVEHSNDDNVDVVDISRIPQLKALQSPLPR